MRHSASAWWVNVRALRLLATARPAVRRQELIAGCCATSNAPSPSTGMMKRALISVSQAPVDISACEAGGVRSALAARASRACDVSVCVQIGVRLQFLAMGECCAPPVGEMPVAGRRRAPDSLAWRHACSPRASRTANAVVIFKERRPGTTSSCVRSLPAAGPPFASAAAVRFAAWRVCEF